MSSTRWLFEEYDPNTANIDGKIADLVKNLTLDNPGILGVGAIGQDRPSDEAGLLAREAVRNAWDNAIERATFEGVKPDCQLEFRFLELRGREKAAFVETAALQELANRSEQVSPVATGFSDEQTYEKLNDPDHPLRVMQLIERRMQERVAFRPRQATLRQQQLDNISRWLFTQEVPLRSQHST